MTAYPKAEAHAAAMALPMTTCKVTRELYGYALPVLDVTRAAWLLASAGFYCGTPAHAAAIEILNARADALATR